MTQPLACTQHDHNHCIEQAISDAKQLCQANGARLTDLRLQVLKLIWQSHKPLGAYTLMDMLAEENTRRVAPPTVYRALDFLLEHKLVHRINCLNAFMGCPSPGKPHANHFLICEACGIASECQSPILEQSLSQAASEQGFTITSQSVEIVGLCSCCQTAQEAK